jgi:hypothetical protein
VPAGRSGPCAPGDVHRAAAVAPPRAAGDSAPEVAAANPGLTTVIPAVVLHPRPSSGESGAGGAAEAAPLTLWDGSGMEVPELAVHEGWGGGGE